MKYETEMDAVRAWANQFSNIPTSLVERAFKSTTDELELLAGGDKRSDCCDAEVMAGTARDASPRESAKCTKCGEAVEGDLAPADWHWGGAEYGWPAAWGTMFSPPERLDEEWIRENVTTVADCGFLVYDSDETGILLGVDGAGYDFHLDHWLPLYRARGLHWHVTDEPAPAPTKASKPTRKASPKRAAAPKAKAKKPAGKKNV